MMNAGYTQECKFTLPTVTSGYGIGVNAFVTRGRNNDIIAQSPRGLADVEVLRKSDRNE
jgi:hypothetical protein